MAFEVVVYFVPRLTRALRATLSSAPQDESLIVAVAETVVWTQPRAFQPWPVTIQFTGALPEGDAPAVTTIETPPAWQPRPFSNQYRPRQVWSAPPGDESLAATPEYAQGRIVGREVFKVPYAPGAALQHMLGTAAYDESVVITGPPPELGRIVRALYADPYRATLYMGAPPLDDTLDLDANVRRVARPPFRDPYTPRRALEHLFNISYDDSGVVAAQPDQQARLVVRTYRVPYSARGALASLLNHPAYDDSFAVAAQEETAGIIVRNPFRESYNPKAALAGFRGGPALDDSSAPILGTSGVYIPVLRRRRR